MKKSRSTEQQIAFALQQAEGGTSVEEVCRKMGISQATFFRWKKVYGGLMPSEVRRLKQLEEENGRLRKLVADLTLDKEMLTEVIKKRMARPVRNGRYRDGTIDLHQRIRSQAFAWPRWIGVSTSF